MDGVGFTAARNTSGIPSLIPPSIPPQLLLFVTTRPEDVSKQSLFSLPRILAAAKPAPVLSTLDKLSADVNTLLAKDHPDVKAEDLIVSGLFDVRYVENGAVAPLNQKVTITFKLTVPVENVLLVLHKTSGGDWELMNMDSSKYQKLDKYQVKLTFDSLSPVVFAIDSAEFHVDPNGPSSPQTGEISPVVVIAGMTIVAACAAAYVVRKEKAAR